MSTNPTSLRLLSQQLCMPEFSNPSELVGYMGAIQAQDYRMARWAVCMRLRSPSLKAFQSEFDQGRILRLHLFRGTWQLVSSQDYSWMLGLCRDKARKVFHGWMRQNQIDIPGSEILRIGDLLQRIVSDMGSATREEIAGALEKHDVLMDRHRLSYHLRLAEIGGLICSGLLHPMKATYSLVADKIGIPSEMDHDEALMQLSRKYFMSHGPATLQDFLWWSGLGVGDARKGMSILGSELRSMEMGERTFFWHEASRMTGSCRRAIFLPPYDEYLIGYKTRDVALDPDFSHKAHNQSGIFYPVILYEGRVCGNWHPYGRKMEMSFFGRKEPPQRILETAWKRYSTFFQEEKEQSRTEKAGL